MASEFEEFMLRRGRERGWKILTKGWPDFLYIKKNRFLAVEVKSRRDKLKPHQTEMLRTLQQAGFEVRVAYEEDLQADGGFGMDKFRQRDPEIYKVELERFVLSQGLRDFDGLGIS